ncbi:MAG: glycerol-3-phosphate 1-O-acyltransferase PlsY [Bacilli bacterium]|nr:glycerol-3-phosphate 1-O-acyltransferase PlsY [Bacilli bacterium]
MNVFVNIVVAVLAVVLGYLLGSIPTGVVIGRVFFHKDPRDYGSHNSGGTNTGRVLGKKIGLLVIVLDALKAAIALYTVWAIVTFSGIHQYMFWEVGYYAAPLYYWLAGLSAAIGHCFSIFLKFKGGKAVACDVGLVVTVSWLELLVGILSFFIPLKLTKHVSLSSIILSVLVAITMWILAIVRVTTDFNTQLFTWGFASTATATFALPILGFEAAAVLTIMAAVIIIRHAANIQRLKNGTESKITWMK